MHITPDQYPFAYAQMETVAYQQNAPAILLLVAEDVDALAACKILTVGTKITHSVLLEDRVGSQRKEKGRGQDKRRKY